VSEERKDFIAVSSMYGAREHQPAVMFQWGAESGVLTVNEARKHALRILEAAEGAEGDAFLADWFRQYAKADERTIAQLLHEFRKARNLRREKEEGV